MKKPAVLIFIKYFLLAGLGFASFISSANNTVGSFDFKNMQENSQPANIIENKHPNSHTLESTYEITEEEPQGTKDIDISFSDYLWMIIPPKKNILRQKIGSGFFIFPNVFVTALHTIDDAIKDKNINKIYIGKNINNKKIRVNKILALSVEMDLALLETEESAPHYLKAREETLDDSLEKLFVVGYQSGYSIQALHNVNQINKLHNWLYFNANRSNLSGMSGGPLIDEQGQVAAVLSSGYANALLASELIDFLYQADNFSCADKKAKACLKDSSDLLQVRAKNGDAPSQFILGLYYYTGANGLKKNKRKAKKWLTLAAEQDHPIAQHILGQMLSLKIFRKKRNREEAIYWLMRSAEADFIPAIYDLAMIMKTMGRMSEAESLFLEAAKAGFMPAIIEYSLMTRLHAP